MPKETRTTAKMDKLVVGLTRCSNLESEADQQKVRSLIGFYKRRGYLSRAQQGLAAGLIRRSIRAKEVVSGDADKIYLYAISDEESVKLGFSRDPKRRLNNLQTAATKKLRIVWQYYVGRSEDVARRIERKLHRYCKAFRIRGEWFRQDCLQMVLEFHVRQESKKAADQTL